MHIQKKFEFSIQRWYFTTEEIEDHSPSRRDEIDYEKESHLRKLYCFFLQELGMELKVPQVTIATVMMLRHHFYMRQSHGKNHWQALVAAMKGLEISNKEMVKVAWNFVNGWLRTTLYLQYKPHYVADGSMFLAAKLLKVKLPTEKGNPWWMQFDVAPKQLEEVIQKMLQLLKQNQTPVIPSTFGKLTELKPVAGKVTSSSTESCITSVSVVAQDSRNMELVENRGPSTSVTSNSVRKRPATASTLSRRQSIWRLVSVVVQIVQLRMVFVIH